MKKRIFFSVLLTSFFLIAATASVIMLTVYNEFTSERKNEIAAEARYICTAYSSDFTDYLSKIGKAGKNRITLISRDGNILFDSYADADSLENHGNRSEIISAGLNGTGEAVRVSSTIGEKTYYYAIRLDDGNILRIAAAIKGIAKIIDSGANYVFLMLLLAALLSVLLARVLTKFICAPINNIDLENPLTNSTYDELSPLLVKMDRQNRTIAEQINELKTKQKELSEITNGMNEALVIFGTDKKVLSANHSAEVLFEKTELTALSYIELCRNTDYIRLIELAFDGKSTASKLKKNGRIFRLSANAVKKYGNFAVVLFAEDITEAERCEQMRREFSANVSHELKTPLTTILGSAELMQNGIAKAEDYPLFISRIYSEASRLLSLIEDIIRLSSLDEGELKLQFSEVDLLKIARQCSDELMQKAQKRNVTIEADGKSINVNAIENTLHEMIFNLCDNAIAYNKENGSVRISVGLENEKPVISITDTGIGIAPEHQSRIFERFYRVDKSHSKETGGTGLGLSIVKHGAALHNADIRLSSTPGKGSCISLIFN